MSKLNLLVFFFLAGSIVSSSAFDATGMNYCDPELCKWQPEGHIGCNNNGQWDPKCSADKALVPIEGKIDLILHLHNKYRSLQALGEQPGFLTASRMPTLKWNNELAYLCELNVKKCDNSHDNCHNTKDFMFSGQNLGALANNVRYVDEDEFINNMVDGWFTEYTEANQTTIDKCCSRGPSNKPIGHFTQLMNDRSTEVGCAISKFQTGNYKNLYLCCNYASANLVGYSSYKTGPTGSKCNTGLNSLYPGLCHDSEKVNPNMYF